MWFKTGLHIGTQECASYHLTITRPKQDEKNSLSGHGLG